MPYLRPYCHWNPGLEPVRNYNPYSHSLLFHTVDSVRAHEMALFLLCKKSIPLIEDAYVSLLELLNDGAFRLYCSLL